MKDVVDDGILAVITLPDTYASLQPGVDKFYLKDEDPLVTKRHKDMVYLHAVV